MKIYSVIVTYKCDWRCAYCSADTHTKKSPSFEHIKRIVDDIELNSEVALTGGEPGYAKPEVIEYVIKTLKDKNCHITINTNGAFFKRYPQYCDQVNDFFYHCTEDLNTEKEIFIPEGDYLIDYMLVVSDENYERLDHFITNYPDIEFLITGADPLIVNGVMGPSLSRKFALKIIQKYHKQIHPDSVIRLLESSDKLCAEEGIIIQ